jgi:hypothetical protein
MGVRIRQKAIEIAPDQEQKELALIVAQMILQHLRSGPVDEEECRKDDRQDAWRSDNHEEQELRRSARA